MFEAPSDSDEDGSSDSDSSIVTRKGVLGSSPVGMTAAGISGGSPAGNNSKRGGKGTTAAGISGGSPAANTRGNGKEKKKIGFHMNFGCNDRWPQAIMTKRVSCVPIVWSNI